MVPMSEGSLYLEGEEKFGVVSSCIYSKLVTPVLNRYYKIIVDDLYSKKIGKLLDIGSGPGKVAINLAKRMDSTKIYCVDPSPSMIKLAKRNASKNGVGEKIIFSIGSSREIPFDLKFDGIISSFSYHHWKDRDHALTKLADYLESGGFIYIYEYDNNGKLKNSHGVREEEWENLKIDGFNKIIEHKSGMIILRLIKI